VTAVLEARGLGKRYRRKWALRDCTVDIPKGQVVGLVGPNGAGKSTLLNMAVGLAAPTSGSIRVLDGVPGVDPGRLGRVGFVAQNPPTYAGLSVEEHLRFGAHLNPSWDAPLARKRVDELGLDVGQRAGKLSGGQRAQLALTLAIAKRPDFLVLDEPVASLDPLARREFLRVLMATVAEHEVTVVLSSHLVSDIERVCNYVVVLAASRVQLSGSVDDLVAAHHRLIGPRTEFAGLPEGQDVIEASHTDRQTTLFVRSDGPITDPAWTIEAVTLEDLVLAYMGRSRSNTQGGEPAVEDPS
jgi:ABC-2 type transport system ATP-binding protein